MRVVKKYLFSLYINMDRMPTFDNATATLEIEPVEDMPRQQNEKIEPPVERETPFLPPKSAAKQTKPKKPMTEKQAAHMERMRMRKLELQQARMGKKFEKKQDPTPEIPNNNPPVEEEAEEVAPPKKTKKAASKEVVGKSGAVDTGFESWLDNYEMMKKIEMKIQAEERSAREAEERKKQKEAEKERAMEERLRKKILAEQQNRKIASQPRRWTPATKQPIPATQGMLQTQSEDFGIYSNRYF
tara:strand:+ start:249 stop:977 length:729 start_codon:yes stop_codon:yes gene_type:complete